MGAGLSHAASGVGAFLGNLVTAPLKSLFGGSCDDICAGPWDVGCFIDHLCISNLLKFVLILALCYIILVFLYLLFKIGICQCVIKSLCKMCWAGFATYCYALHDCTCCLWHKLMRVRHTNRRRRKMRRRFQDIERGSGGRGYDVDSTSTTSSSSLSSSAGRGGHLGGGRKRKSVRMREDEWRRSGVAASRRRKKSLSCRNGRGIRVRTGTAAKDVSAAASASASLSSRRRLRGSRRRVQLIKGKKMKKPAGKKGVGSFKRRRLK
ncbi:unnamed protein product [Linum tenue]|uniref:Uncharacterized protein n=1 Tax=Linum tenue TaxID=586396 RepID=A0AAV0JJQ7_9ROSI|nr:unnamed protein product [Linum tenue]